MRESEIKERIREERLIILRKKHENDVANFLQSESHLDKKMAVAKNGSEVCDIEMVEQFVEPAIQDDILNPENAISDISDLSDDDCETGGGGASKALS